MSLLSVIANWVLPTPLPDFTVIEAEFVGGPHDGGVCVSHIVGSVKEGDVRTIDGLRYRLERRGEKRFWRTVLNSELLP